MNKDTKGNHIEPSEDSLYKVKSRIINKGLVKKGEEPEPEENEDERDTE